MTVAREDWPAGVWDQEEDQREWEAHGLKCLVVRHSRDGHLCGYVTSPRPGVLIWDGREITHRGGLEPPWDGPVWVGMHFGGTWDYCPGMDARGMYDVSSIDPTERGYRTFTEVVEEVERLAKALAID